MKKGINFWSFRDGTGIQDAILQAKDAGFDGIEFVVSEDGPITMDSTEKDILRIREMVERAGLQTYSLATSLFWKYSLCSDDETVVEKGKDLARRMLDIARWLDCTGILVVPGAVEERSGLREITGGLHGI